MFDESKEESGAASWHHVAPDMRMKSLTMARRERFPRAAKEILHFLNSKARLRAAPKDDLFITRCDQRSGEDGGRRLR